MHAIISIVTIYYRAAELTSIMMKLPILHICGLLRRSA